MNKNIKEISNKTIKELRELLTTKREDLFKLRMDKTQNKLKNTRSIFFARKEIARIMTLIREKELVLEQKKEEAPAGKVVAK